MALTISLTTTTIASIVLSLACAISQSSQHDSLARKPQGGEPPIFVIEPEAYVKNLGQLTTSTSSNKQWNNQKLIHRKDYHSIDQQRQEQQSLSARSSARSAKQLLHQDQAIPYYHSYKYMNLNGYASSAASAAAFYSHPLTEAGAPAGYAVDDQAVWLDPSFGERQNLPGELRGATKTSDPQPTKGGKTSNRRFGQRPHRRPELELEAPVDEVSPVDRPINRANQNNRKNLVCYYGTWAVYRPDAGKYPVENIDPFLCTHVIYGFTGLSYDNMIKPLDPWNDLEDNYGKGAMKRFTNLKKINPDLKTLVAIGGWNEGSVKYSKMASEPEARARFVASVVEFLKKYNFDGLDLDWEYPGSRGGQSYDKQNFVRLLKELKEAFRPNGFLLTAAVSAGKWFMEAAYDIPKVNEYLDLINLMAYDYHGGWESKTGMNAPLYHSEKFDLSKEDKTLNVNWSVNYWLQQGASPEKLMLGVGSYGRSFTLDKLEQNGLNAPANQKGRQGPYTREPGSLGYNEICEMFKREPNSWTIVRDADYLAPYAYNSERQWVGYDDIESLTAKAEYANSMGLGGMMMWSIETDDFHGSCHNGQKYPLLNTIRRVIDGEQGQQVKPVAPATTARPKPASGGAGSTTSARPGPQRPAPTTSRRPAITPTKPNHEVEDEAKPSSSTSTTTTTPRPTPSKTKPTSSTTRRPSAPSTTSTSTTSTRRPTGSGAEFVCQNDGMFADPSDCRKFIRCVSSGSGFTVYKFDCGPGTAFSESAQVCDFIYNVPGCSNEFRMQLIRDNTILQPAVMGPSSIRKQLPFVQPNYNYKFNLVHHLMPGPASQSHLLGYWRPY